MNRTGILTVVAMMLASSPSFGQYGGMGGVGGGMGGMGGGMGGQAMAPGMMVQGGRFANAGVSEVRRAAQVEMEGGQRLSGKVDLRTIVVDGDLGRYLIAPAKIKAIRFLKPVDEAKPGNDPAANNNGDINAGDEGVVGRGGRQNRPAILRASRAAGGFGGGDTPAPIRGKVITTTDKEIIGTIHLPADFRLELDFGSLALVPDKLRSITFTEDHRNDKPADAGAKVPGAGNDPDRAKPGPEASAPRYFRQGNSIIVISPVGDRATLFNCETQKSDSLELSGTKDAPLRVTPVVAQNLIALNLSGPKLTRIAVADLVRGNWHVQELRKPIDGRAIPLVTAEVVVYTLGREVYAYGAAAQRWDVVELPEGTEAMPTVGPGGATIEGNGHIYTFVGTTGRWNHVDIRALLDGKATEK
jgi:hypothetical protein